MNLMFLPRASGCTEFWQPVMAQLPKNDTQSVLAYPSFGGYADHAQITSFDDLQAYVLDQIQQPLVLIAQSMGGIFAIQAALQKPQLIQALVLVATSGGIDLSRFDVADWRETYQQTFTVPDWFIHQRSNLDPELVKIQCPVLLIWGADDLISPVAVGQYLQKQLPQSRLSIVGNGQHDVAKVHAEQVGGLIHDFLKSACR